MHQREAREIIAEDELNRRIAELNRRIADELNQRRIADKDRAGLWRGIWRSWPLVTIMWGIIGYVLYELFFVYPP